MTVFAGPELAEHEAGFRVVPLQWPVQRAEKGCVIGVFRQVGENHIVAEQASRNAVKPSALGKESVGQTVESITKELQMRRAGGACGVVCGGACGVALRQLERSDRARSPCLLDEGAIAGGGGEKAVNLGSSRLRKSHPCPDFAHCRAYPPREEVFLSLSLSRIGLGGAVFPLSLPSSFGLRSIGSG